MAAPIPAALRLAVFLAAAPVWAQAPPAPAPHQAGAVDRAGDPVPPGAVARLGTTRFRHDGTIRHAAWSPDGKLVATAAGPTVTVWDADTGRERARRELGGAGFPDSEYMVSVAGGGWLDGLDWSPDGKALATAFGGQAQLWAWDDGASRLSLTRSLPATGRVPPDGARFAGPGRLLTVGNRLAVHDLVGLGAPREVLLDSPGVQQVLLAAPADGAAVAVLTRERRWEEARLAMYDLKAGGDPRVLVQGPVTHPAVSRDGTTVVAVCPHGKEGTEARIWETRTWTSRRVPLPGRQVADVTALAVSPDGKAVVTGGADRTLRWWDPATGKEVRRAGPLPEAVYRAAFRPDGKVLLTAGAENRARFWDAATGEELAGPAGPPVGVAAAAITPDGKCVLAVAGRTVYAWDPTTGLERWRRTGHADKAPPGENPGATQLVVTPDGKSAVTCGADGAVVVWDVATGKEVRRFEGPPGGADLLALSPDGRVLAALGTTAPHDRRVRRWDLATGRALPGVTPAGPNHAAHALLFAPDGAGLAVGTGTRTDVSVWVPDRPDPGQVLGPTDTGVWCLAYSPDGRTLAGVTTPGGTLYLWEVATGQERLAVKKFGQVAALAWAPDGRALAVANWGPRRLPDPAFGAGASHPGSVVRLVDPFTGREVHRLPGHAGRVSTLAWSADGRRLVSGGHDTTCLVWDVTVVPQRPPRRPVEPGDMDRLWEALAHPTAAQAYRAMAAWTADPAGAAAGLRGRLKADPPADPDRVARLVQDLDSSQFATRERATADLVRLGAGAEGPLQKALGGGLSAEARERAGKALADLRRSPERLRAGRALEVLERAGGAECRAVLKHLAGGPDGAWLTREAEAALARLGPSE